MPIKSFRGLIVDNGQDKIILHTNTGSTGYRIKKFEVISETPGDTADESILKIYKVEQLDNIPGGTDLYGKIDFNDQTLIGVGYWSAATSSGSAATMNIIVENEIFNQDIYITHRNISGASPGDTPCNYYLELEQVKLDLNENTVATLKDIRNETLAV